MKIEIKNLGAVKEGQVKIKPLTVFIGPNNSGKTWTAYGVSSIFGPIALGHYSKYFLEESFEKKYPEIENLISNFFNKGNANLNIVHFFEQNFSFYFNDLAKLSPKWMNKFLGTENVSFENLSISICKEPCPEDSIKRLLKLSFNSELSPDKEEEPIVKVNKNEQDPLIYFYLSEKRKTELPEKILINSILEIIFHYVHRALYYNVRYLPAERTGFISLLASEILGEKQKKDLVLEENTGEKIDLLMPVPIIKMINNLKIIQQPSKYNFVLKRRSNNKKLKKFQDLATLFETSILDGALEYEGNHLNKGISNLCYRYHQNKDVPLELQVASSTVKDLVPLSVYLKCLLHENELLVIDEPEMNLHPENQAKFMEFLVMLVNSGVSVMLTTHSPYMTNHLENLIKAYSSKQSDLENLFYLKRREAFISKENVSVYYFGNGGIKNILEENGNIDLGSFSDVGEGISEIFYDIE